MPNYCDYTLKVKGDKANCETFLKKMEDYDEPNHFFRIFEIIVEEEGDDYLVISGNCAWSIESCCSAGGYSNGIDLFAVNTKDLDLDLEVWSSETDGCFFEEHYIYNKGKCLVDDCESTESEYYPYWDKTEFPTFEDYIAEFELSPGEVSEDDFDENGEYITEEISGFDNWGNWSI